MRRSGSCGQYVVDRDADWLEGHTWGRARPARGCASPMWHGRIPMPASASASGRSRGSRAWARRCAIWWWWPTAPRTWTRWRRASCGCPASGRPASAVTEAGETAASATHLGGEWLRWSGMTSAGASGPDDRSVLGKSGKGLLCSQVPPHPRHGILPPPLHALQGAPVRLITSGDHLFQMRILRFYHRIGGISMEMGVTRSTHLCTDHCLHLCHISVLSARLAARARLSVPRRRSSRPSARSRSATSCRRQGAPCR